jgi:hypothetical protein
MKCRVVQYSVLRCVVLELSFSFSIQLSVLPIHPIDNPLPIHHTLYYLFDEHLYSSYLPFSPPHPPHTHTHTHTHATHTGAPDRSDPMGVDMGMDRGLQEPTFKLPPSEEPLWLEKIPVDGVCCVCVLHL